MVDHSQNDETFLRQPAATVSAQEIAEMRRALNAATPGDWCHRRDGKPELNNQTDLIETTDGVLVAYGHLSAADAVFCVAAQRNMPRLLDAIEALTAENARLRKQVEYEQRCGAEYVASLADVRADNARLASERDEARAACQLATDEMWAATRDVAEAVAQRDALKAEVEQLASERDTLRDAVAEGWSIIGGLRAEVEAAHAAAKSDALWHGPMTDVVADIRPALTAQPGESPLADPEYPELVRMARESSKDGD